MLKREELTFQRSSDLPSSSRAAGQTHKNTLARLLAAFSSTKKQDFHCLRGEAEVSSQLA